MRRDKGGESTRVLEGVPTRNDVRKKKGAGAPKYLSETRKEILRAGRAREGGKKEMERWYAPRGHTSDGASTRLRTCSLGGGQVNGACGAH